jgi:hypothetical protein
MKQKLAEKKKKERKQTNGKCNNIGSADENIVTACQGNRIRSHHHASG